MKYILFVFLIITSKNAFAFPTEFIAAKTIGMVVLILIFFGIPILYNSFKDRKEEEKIRDFNLKKYGKSSLIENNEDPIEVGNNYYKIANSAFLSKDYVKAKLHLEMCLEILDHKEAHYLMGIIYKRGYGATINNEKARNFFIKSYNAGKVYALREYLEILDKVTLDNIKLSIEEQNPLKYVSYFTKTEIYLSQVIWLKSGLNFFSNQLITLYNKRKRKNKDSAIVDFTYVYNACKSSEAKSKLLLLFYNYNFRSTKSIFLTNKKIRDYYYSSFKFLNTTNDIAEKTLGKEFKHELFENPFLEFLEYVPIYKYKTIWEKLYESDSGGWDKIFDDLASSKLYKGREI